MDLGNFFNVLIVLFFWVILNLILELVGLFFELIVNVVGDKVFNKVNVVIFVNVYFENFFIFYFFWNFKNSL